MTKVHHEVKVRAGKGYRIVYVGHEGHEEAVGTMAVAPERDHAGSRRSSEVAALPDFDEPVALLAQTTLSHRDWGDVAVAVRERFPDVWSPGRSDLCFATTNRQSALMELAKRCDAIVVIGSANSSNTRALEKLAREAGCERVVRVNTADEIPDDLLADARVVGVTAGASAPNELVDADDRPPRTRPTASRSSRSPTRTSTSRRRATCASCRRRSRSRRRRCSAARSPLGPGWTIAGSAPATC